MAKLLVKDPKTGNIRPMTQKSFDTAGKKRGFTIVGKEAETGEKSEIQQHMDRLIAEKAEKNVPVNEAGLALSPHINAHDAAQTKVKERLKPGPKSKTQSA